MNSVHVYIIIFGKGQNKEALSQFISQHEGTSVNYGCFAWVDRTDSSVLLHWKEISETHPIVDLTTACETVGLPGWFDQIVTLVLQDGHQALWIT